MLTHLDGHHDRINEMKESLNLVKLRIFSPDGTIIYSSDSTEIGTVNNMDYFHQQVAKGRKFTKVVEKNSGKTQEGAQLTRDVVETYVPIMVGETFIGAAEVYFDITDRENRINATVSRASLATFVIIILFLTLLISLTQSLSNKELLSDDNLSIIYRSPYIAPVIIGFVIFFAEGLVMLLLNVWPKIPPWTEAILDATLLVLILLPVFYFFVVVPLMKHISKQKQAELEINQLAYFDSLTGLPNRTLFYDRLSQALFRARRDGIKIALLYFDLDRFKEVNDSFGHHIGDLLLQEVARRLQQFIRHSDSPARIGGDEFCHLLTSLKKDQGAAVMADKILAAIKAPFELEGKQLFTSASIGIAIFPENGENAETLLKHADISMYAAKAQGGNCFAFFCEEMNRQAQENRHMEADLRRALDNDEFYLEYQPQFDLGLNRIVGAEALVRWNHPEKGVIPPVQFIPPAEETGLIAPLGEWVLRTACRQNKAWQEAGYAYLRMAVNLSAYQLRQSDFVKLVDCVLQDTWLDPRWLELELTESLVMENAELSRDVLAELSKRGIHLTIDDFGTGYSSLSYLKNFTVDRIKIDRSFVGQLPDALNDAAIVETILAMARTLKLEVVAEGVETKEQLDFLKKHDCRVVQGFYLGCPMRAELFVKHLDKFAELY
jgi:diguanylate cyclase (GGDEF)-like protein